MNTIMSDRFRALLGLGSAVLIAAALVPTAAFAAPDVPPLSALVDRDETGAVKSVFGKPGDLVAPVVGVANLSAAPIKGAAVQIRVIQGLDLPRTFSNCQYYVDASLEGVWCRLDEELAVNGTYALADFRVAITPDATRADAVIIRWITPEEVTAGGGIEALAKRDSRTGQSTAGTQGTLRLEPRDLPLPAAPNPIGFASVKVIVPSAPPSAPTTPPISVLTPLPAESTAEPTPPADGGDGGGLPVTGAATTSVVGFGVALLILGGATFMTARRRRTRFEA